jgi:hypothetical protein
MGDSEMARIYLPLEELIAFIKGNMKLGPMVTSVMATDQGPKIGTKVAPLIPTVYVTVRFKEYKDTKALFVLDGIPPLVFPLLSPLINRIKFPEGISIVGNNLIINTKVLIEEKLKLKNLKVSDINWDHGEYLIQTMTA